MNENNNSEHIFIGGESHNHCSFVVAADVHHHRRHIRILKKILLFVRH
jgi:hypothetical protein